MCTKAQGEASSLLLWKQKNFLNIHWGNSHQESSKEITCPEKKIGYLYTGFNQNFIQLKSIIVTAMQDSHETVPCSLRRCVHPQK